MKVLGGIAYRILKAIHRNGLRLMVVSGKRRLQEEALRIPSLHQDRNLRGFTSFVNMSLLNPSPLYLLIIFTFAAVGLYC